jgi:hypothetical protein
MADYTGYTDEEMKGVLKYKFNISSTSALSTLEFMEFIRNIQSWAATLGVSIPDPKEDA